MSTLATESYWCYRCSRLVRVLSRDSSVACPNCDSGFVEAIESPIRSANVDARRGRFHGTARYMIGYNSSNPGQNSRHTPGRARTTGSDRSPFNPVILLRGPSDRAGANPDGGRESRGFQLYYEDGDGSGLRQLPASMSEILLGSGFDRLLDQLSRIELNGASRCDHAPASKSAIEAMPAIEIGDDHLTTESHCAVCIEQFRLGSEAREMPCKHIYHPECILPWLSLRNSCPVCRYEVPSDTENTVAESDRSQSGQSLVSNLDENVGLTVWRLPGGGFAVGRFSRGRGREGEQELPVVYTEVDSGFNNSGAPRRILWTAGRSIGRESGGFGGAFRNMFSCFRGIVPQVSRHSSNLDSRAARRWRSVSPINSRTTGVSLRRRTWSMEVNRGIREW
ncbi:E3 ubiquitin-protein ligase RING1-like [Morella rubra]|uniref:RING-type E3 ubiquitin transferase n=1 Tax=Morella rubra TaxID=262757 RepID=A0A6A1VXY4_9ROSI|nr:E3 ubiquitin-protein ligase RING1-like [Morella rubra]